jgi:hypothetical protein
MGTGAVYVLLSALDPHPEWVTTVEVVFFFLAIFLFSLNISTLALQGIREYLLNLSLINILTI